MTRDSTTRRYQAVLQPPYIPKVVKVDANHIASLCRWGSHAEHNRYYLPCSVSPICAAVEFAVQPGHHRRTGVISLVDQSGYLAFRLLHVRTFPESCYLLCAAFLLDGDRRWVDGMLLEELFDSVKSISLDYSNDAQPLTRINYGLECHRQLSLAHWQEYRKRKTAELEEHIGNEYLNKASGIERRLRELRWRGTSTSPSGEERAYLRKALLDAESQEGEVSRFLDRLVAAPPTYDLQDVFAIEWHVCSDVSPAD